MYILSPTAKVLSQRHAEWVQPQSGHSATQCLYIDQDVVFHGLEKVTRCPYFLVDLHAYRFRSTESWDA